jgi:sulfide:quinone oxidoreductase
MRNIVILGAGTAGTMMANRLCTSLRHEIETNEISITVVDQNREHVYQPGLLFIPFGVYKDKHDLIKPRENFLPREVEFLVSSIHRVDPEKKTVYLEKGELQYDLLIIASGSIIDPTEQEGLTGKHWKKSIFDFYTVDGAMKLQKAMRTFRGGNIILNIAEMPVKCPVAPPEFVMLADWYFHERGLRDKVKIFYSTPLDGPFTKPIASRTLQHVCNEKGIEVVPEFALSHVDNEKQQIISCDGRELDFDLLVSIPTNKGASFLEESGLGDVLNWVPTNNHTF